MADCWFVFILKDPFGLWVMLDYLELVGLLIVTFS